MTQNRRSAIVFALAGGFVLLGASSWLTSRSFAAGPDLNDHIRQFTEVLGVVQEHYVEEPDPKDLVYDSIQYMLQGLDPHSSFLSEDSYREMQAEQRGSFSGLGIVVQKRGREMPLVVISPIDGTPAQRLGIRSGDVISEIEGETTDGLTINDAVKKLRGPKGTVVNISISRKGVEEPLPFAVTRDDIPTNSLSNAYMIRPGTGYIKINNFTMTTAGELDEATQMLMAEGMEEMILDLRSNPGGLLDAAVDVTSRFIDSGKLAVYTRGRVPSADKEYYSSGEENAGRYPLVILVNHGSASASEIVSGAVQDHDRGLVVGETTWGKGLVQSVYTLSQRNGLALTTAKYYTPSGRLIQRDYDDLEEYYLYFSDEDAEPEIADGPLEEVTPEIKPTEEREAYQTDTGRTVYGGGGITPDVVVAMPRLSDFMAGLNRRQVFFDFAVHLQAYHPELSENFQVGEQVMQTFRDFLTDKEIEYTEAELEEDTEMVSLFIRAQHASTVHGLKAAERIRNAVDPQVQKALELMPEARTLAEDADQLYLSQQRERSDAAPSIR